jgi:hypothetical protein
MQIYQSRFLQVDYNKENRSVVVVWSAETQEMDEVQFRQELIHSRDAIIEFSANQILIDSSQFFFSIAPEMQEWINKYVHSKIAEVGIAQVAHVVSPDIFAQLSIEQTMAEGNAGELFETAYFDTQAEAQKWLDSQKFFV